MADESHPPDNQLQPDEEPDDLEPVDPEHPYAWGINEVLGAIAKFIEKEKFGESVGNIVQALTAWMKSKSEISPDESVFRRHYLWGNLGFSTLVFAGILIAGYFKIIPPEGTTGLLGALIGYWYGQRQRDK